MKTEVKVYVAVGSTGQAASGDTAGEALERFLYRHGTDEAIHVYTIEAHLKTPDEPTGFIIGEPDNG